MHRVPRRVMGWFVLSGGAARRQHLQHHVMDSRECLLHPAQLFFRQFGRRQACSASKRNASGPLDVCAVRFGEAPRSGAECFDRIYCFPAACFPISVSPIPFCRHRQAHGAFKFKGPDCGVAGVQCVVEEPRSGADCFDVSPRPASQSRSLGRRQARCTSKLNEPNIRLPCVQLVGEAPRSGVNCFDTIYRVPANRLSMLNLGRRQESDILKLKQPDVCFPRVQRVGEAAKIAPTRRIELPRAAFQALPLFFLQIWPPAGTRRFQAH
ncbi:hypothetical protein C8R47DRAFT_724780 [Mycena vitilis]|nr:hypothetical protein C8R47DRAFT_724780 [Mycena vitilis]